MGFFTLTEVKKNILEGRGMKLVCAAPLCLYASGHENDNDWNKQILVTGTSKCMNCGNVYDWKEFIKHDDSKSQAIFKDKEFVSKKNSIIKECPNCKNNRISETNYTQKVYSKHHKNSHLYYHEVCWLSLYIGDDSE
jgi:predicted Zn-ribbon and HTH transcriptional regulator